MNGLPALALLLNLLSGTTALTGNGRIHGTDEWLRFQPRAGSGIAVGAETSAGMVFEASALRTFLPAEIRGMHRSRDIALVPISGTILTRIARNERFESFAGAGIVYIELRHGGINMATPQLSIGHLAQPDHIALLLQASTHVRLDGRWYAVADARYGPAASTIEVRPAGTGSDLQANFHPLILTGGLGIRF